MRNTVTTILLVGLNIAVSAGFMNAQTQKPAPAVATVKLSSRKTLGFVYRFKSSPLYKKYKLNKTDGWKLSTGAYNLNYSSTFSKSVIELQIVGNKITGADIIFYDRQVLSESELDLVVELIEFLNGNSKLDVEQRKLIQASCEKVAKNIADNDVIKISNLTINAANMRGRTILVQAVAR